MKWHHELRAALAGGVRVRLRARARKFLAATQDCRRTQARVLQKLLRLNGDSRFSREYRLDQVGTPADLARHLPVTDYEDFAPYVECLTQGDHRALLGRRNRLLMFTMSSGTTADSKLIPVTRPFLADYRRGWQTWGILAFDDHPGVHSKKIVQIASDHNRLRTPGGTPCGNISGLVTSMQNTMVRLMYAVPPAICKISNSEAKNYTTLRLALADDSVGTVSTANPSTVLHLAQMADACRDSLIRDIFDGTLSDRYEIPAPIRARLNRAISRRRPKRARTLERLVEQRGRLLPQDYWPHLEFLAIWTGGSCATYLPQLREYFGEVPIRDHGLSASEGRMTVPIEDGTPDGILEITNHFFEFIPEREYESSRRTVVQAHELQEGEDYYILLTTSSGFYRYDICDVVRCVGFYNSTPLLRFLHKGAHISSITGEKISESQVVDAVQSCVRELPWNARQFTVVPVWGDPPEYSLLVEEQDVESHWAGERLVERVDRRLQELNCEYRDKRASGRLAPMTFVPLPCGSWDRFAAERRARCGGCIEQYKHPFLVPDMELGALLLKEAAVSQYRHEEERAAFSS